MIKCILIAFGIYAIGVWSGIFISALLTANGREPYEDQEQIESLKKYKERKKSAKDRNEY